MKILHVISSLNPNGGGTVESLIQSSAAHVKMGVETSVVVCDDPNAKWLSADQLKHLDVHALGAGNYGWAYRSSLLPWLQSHIHEFDAVLVHGLWLYPSYAVAKAARKAKRSGCNTVFGIFPHGMLDPWFQKISERGIVKPLRNLLYWHLFEKRVLREADKVFFTCEQERQLARTTFSGYQCNEVVIPFGTKAPPEYKDSFSTAFKAKCPTLEDRSYLLYLSRIHPKKGVDLLIEAWGQCKAKGKQLPDIVIAGPGLDTPYGEKCKALAAQDSQHIHFPGMLQGEAKWGAFYGCEAFVLASHQENFGIVVAEALACGKPVLISNQVNIWREISEAGAGIVAEDTLEGTVSMIKQWVQSSEKNKSTMQKKAKPCFEKHFRVEASAKAILEQLQNSSSE